MTEDEMRKELEGLTIGDLRKLVEELMHAMQSGVKFAHQYKTGTPLARDLKNLRVGVNAAMCQVGAVCVLLTRAGIFSDHEWYVEYAMFLQSDVERLRAEIEERAGHPVSLE